MNDISHLCIVTVELLSVWKVDKRKHTHTNTRPEMGWRESPMIILHGIHTGFVLVNQTTTGILSAATFRAAISARSLLDIRGKVAM